MRGGLGVRASRIGRRGTPPPRPCLQKLVLCPDSDIDLVSGKLCEFIGLEIEPQTREPSPLETRGGVRSSHVERKEFREEHRWQKLVQLRFFLRPFGVDLEAPVVRKKRGCGPPRRRQQLSIVWPDQGRQREESGRASRAKRERKGKRGGTREGLIALKMVARHF